MTNMSFQLPPVPLVLLVFSENISSISTVNLPKYFMFQSYLPAPSFFLVMSGSVPLVSFFRWGLHDGVQYSKTGLA